MVDYEFRNQGAFIIAELTDLVEEAVLKEFEAIASRRGVLGAMETGYPRGKIQKESLHCEEKRLDGSFPLSGANTLLNPHRSGVASETELARSTDVEKQSPLTRLSDFRLRNAGQSGVCLAELKQAVIDSSNVFAAIGRRALLLVGRISNAPYEVGGQYRRSM